MGPITNGPITKTFRIPNDARIGKIGSKNVPFWITLSMLLTLTMDFLMYLYICN